MKTTGNNIPFNGSEYERENNKGLYFIDGLLVAELLFDRDVFNLFDDSFTAEYLDMFYDEMTTAKTDWEYEYKMSDDYGN